MRVCFVHDWLFGMRGGEKCLEELVRMYPDCEIFAGFGKPENLSETIKRKEIIFSLFNSLPGIERFYRYLLPLYPLVALSLSRRIGKRHREEPFDLLISVSHCFAKNVKTPEGLRHICYCLTPMRYIYDQFDSYFGKSVLKPLFGLVASGLRRWDRNKRPDSVVISQFVGSRVKKLYNKGSTVIYPPVNISGMQSEKKSDYYLVANALVPYKNTEVVVRAFNVLGKPLKIVGTGPELSRLKEIAKPNIEFCGWVSEEELGSLYTEARAMVFAACEDFGITPVEAQAHGTPVIAYAAGGALETVTAGTGEFFSELSAAAIAEAVRKFEAREVRALECVLNAERFATGRFRREFSEHVKETLTRI